MPTILRDIGSVALSYSDLDVICRCRTRFHKIVMYRHDELGKILVLDGEVQHVEAWAPLYHEPLVHLASSFLPHVKTVLILGGGSLFTAAEVLKYKSVERAVLIDHEPRVLDICSSHYSQSQRARSDSRLEVHYSDVLHTVSALKQHFDLVINDSIDLKLNQRGWLFRRLNELIGSTGVCADVVYRHVFGGGRCAREMRFLNSSINNVRSACSLLFVPEYPGILHLLVMWGKRNSICQSATLPHNREQREWISEPNANPCTYYDPRFMSYYLYLPPYLRIQLALR